MNIIFESTGFAIVKISLNPNKFFIFNKKTGDIETGSYVNYEDAMNILLLKEELLC